VGLAEGRKTDVLYDLGSGDGRIVIAAATMAGCRAVGYEIDRTQVEQSREAIKRKGLAERAKIEHEDLLKADLTEASVVTLYIGARLNRLMVPKLKMLKPGSRVVSHEFEVPDLFLDRTVEVVSNEDGRNHKVFLYRIEGLK